MEMDFKMKKGDRLKIAKNYVTIFQEDGSIKYYSCNGKFLNHFSKRHLATTTLPWAICTPNCIVTKRSDLWHVFTYDGTNMCTFKAKYVHPYKNYLVILNDDGLTWRLFNTDTLDFVNGTFDKIDEAGNFFFLQKGKRTYLFNITKKIIEKDIDFLVSDNVAYNKSLLLFYLLYKENKCGLYVWQSVDELTEIFPIEYQRINILADNDEIKTLKDGKLQRYSLTEVLEAHPPKICIGDNSEKEITKIYFLNKFKVEKGEELTLDDNFYSLLSKDGKSCKYYNLKGEYIASSTCLCYSDGDFWHKNYIATKKMIILGSGGTEPLYLSDCWKVYNYKGEKIFNNLTFEKVRTDYNDRIILAEHVGENKLDLNTWVIFDSTGDLLFTLRAKDVNFCFDHIEVTSKDDKIEFLDLNGNKIFNERFDAEKISKLGEFLVFQEPYRYSFFNFKEKQKFSIEADSIESFQYDEYKIRQNGKCSIVSINYSGEVTTLIPANYLDIYFQNGVIVAQTECYDDIYNKNFKKIYSTKS